MSKRKPDNLSEMMGISMTKAKVAAIDQLAASWTPPLRRSQMIRMLIDRGIESVRREARNGNDAKAEEVVIA